jgi:hypothetical protein
MKFFTLLIIALSIYYQQVLIKAQMYILSVSAPSGANITEFSGSMMVPTLEKPVGGYYLWTGLEPLNQNGVLQSSLNGSSGTWWYMCGWAWLGNPISWIDDVGSPIPAGQWLNFNFSYISDESGWLIAMTSLAGKIQFSSTFLISKFILVFISSLLHYSC